MIWIGLMVGTATTLLAVVVAVYGLYLGMVRQERNRKALTAEPVCGCRHHASFHTNLVGPCRHNGGGYNQNLTCGCQRYVGPQAGMEIGP